MRKRSEDIEQDFDDEALMNISNHVQKSFVFQMAAKKLSKKRLQKIAEEKDVSEDIRQSLRKTRNIKKNKVPMTVSKLFATTSVKKYKIMMKNLASNQNNKLFCSNCTEIDSLKNREVSCEVGSDSYIEIYQEVKNNTTNKVQKRLFYYISFNTVNASIVEEQALSTSSFILQISQNLKILIKNDENPLSVQSLKIQLNQLIKTSDGKKYKIQNLSNSCNPKFFQSRYKSATQFAEKCETGDIILFRGTHFFGKLQRLLTSSEYDHVGIIIKDPTYGILIFESTGNSGVCLCSWDALIKQQLYQYTQQFVWRKLSGLKRDYQFKNMIHTFVTENLRKKYHISLDKLWMRQSTLKQPKDSEDSKQDGFFCSELVAKTYKSLGLLTKDPSDPNYKASNNFYPYHFTSKFDIKLLIGELSDEYKIHFNKQQIKDYYSGK